MTWRDILSKTSPTWLNFLVGNVLAVSLFITPMSCIESRSNSTLYGYPVPQIVPPMERKVNRDAYQDRYAQTFNDTFHTDLTYSEITNRLNILGLSR